MPPSGRSDDAGRRRAGAGARPSVHTQGGRLPTRAPSKSSQGPNLRNCLQALRTLSCDTTPPGRGGAVQTVTAHCRRGGGQRGAGRAQGLSRGARRTRRGIARRFLEGYLWARMLVPDGVVRVAIIELVAALLSMACRWPCRPTALRAGAPHKMGSRNENTSSQRLATREAAVVWRVAQGAWKFAEQATHPRSLHLFVGAYAHVLRGRRAPPVSDLESQQAIRLQSKQRGGGHAKLGSFIPTP